MVEADEMRSSDSPVEIGLPENKAFISLKEIAVDYGFCRRCSSTGLRVQPFEGTGLTLSKATFMTTYLKRMHLLYIFGCEATLRRATHSSHMTIYEQIKKVMEGKNGMVISSGFIKSELKNKFGVKISSVVPSDFCYNRVNDGIGFRKDNRIFKYIDRNAYEYIGENYPYTGKIYHRPYRSKTDVIVGEWVNGEMKYPL